MVELVPELAALLTDPEPVVLEKMARRLEHYISTGERAKPRAKRMCETCPFRGHNDEQYSREAAFIPAQDWPCHTDESEHCCGHASAQKKYGEPTPEVIRTRIDLMQQMDARK